MKSKYYCFNINSYNQAVKIIQYSKKNKIIPIFYINHNLINNLGTDWLEEFREMLCENFHPNDFKIYINVKRNYGLFISLVQNKVNYLKVDANTVIKAKLKQIANLNKVFINPKFSIIDLSRTKNIIKKLNKITN